MRKSSDAGDTKNAATVYLNLGVLDKFRGDYGKAVENYQEALLIYELENDTHNIGKVLNNIGNVYYNLEQDYEQALKYYEQALQMFSLLKDSVRMANLDINIGAAYNNLKEYKMAKDNFFSGLKIFENNNNIQGIALTYDHLGTVYKETNELGKALEYFLQSKGLYEKLDDARNILLQDLNLGNTYLMQEKYTKAKSHFESCMQEAGNRKLKNVLMEVNKGLSKVYEKQGNHSKALEHFKRYSVYRDSTLNENTQQIVQDLHTKYETDKKQKQLEHEQTQNELLVLRNKRSKGILVGTIGALITILGFSALLYRQFSQKKKANNKLQISNNQIRQQHDKIKQQTEQIKASITYASLIQTAILPPVELFGECFEDYFILFKPCNVVSGDFYWLYKKDDIIVFVCADCTGHGVPGAFMSMLGISAFTHVIGNLSKELSTDLILNEVRNIIIAQLHQTGRLVEARDGMDLSMCIIDQKEMKIQISGAYNPVYLIRDKQEVQIIKGDRMPIGYSSRNNISFTKQVFDLQKGDQFYFFSDGYLDQFGGPLLKKYRSKPFREFIQKNSAQPMVQQGDLLKEELENWINGSEQIDDITVIGIKI